MNDDQIVDYLLGALDGPESEAMERRLNGEPELARCADVQRTLLNRWKLDPDDVVVPAGLAQRTCEAIWKPALRVLSRDHAVWSQRTWGMADALVAVAVGICGMILVLPAVANSRYFARLWSCQENLRTYGSVLSSFALAHDGRLPTVPTRGPASVMGAMGGILRGEPWFISDRDSICPGDKRLAGSSTPLPLVTELEQAAPELVADLQQRIGGSYAFPLPVANAAGWATGYCKRRSNFGMMADAPVWDPATGRVSFGDNHDRKGQNVLFEDWNVRFATSLYWGRDHLNLNDELRLAPGLRPDDTVLAPGHVSPMGAEVVPVQYAR